MKDALVFLVEAHLKPVLGYSSKVGHCEVDFHNVCVELCQHITSAIPVSGCYNSRTRQEALAALLLYLYKYNMVCATTIPNVYASFSCHITYPL